MAEKMTISPMYKGPNAEGLEFFGTQTDPSAAERALLGAVRYEIAGNIQTDTMYDASNVQSFLGWLYNANSRSHYIGCTLTTLTAMSHMERELSESGTRERLQADLDFVLQFEERLFSMLGVVSLVHLENALSELIAPADVSEYLTERAVDFNGSEIISDETARKRNAVYADGKDFFETHVTEIAQFADSVGEDQQAQGELAAIGKLYMQGDISRVADLAELTERLSTVDSLLIDALVARNE